MGEEIKQQVDPGLVPLAEAARQLAQRHWEQKDWSGIPVPVPGLNLVLEPRYKHQGLSKFRWKECFDEDGTSIPIEVAPPPELSDYRRVNSWWNARYQLNVIVGKNDQGRANFAIQSEDRLAFTIRTLEAAAAWPIEAEQKALKKLSGLIPQDQFDLYMLTGHFYEISKRSQLLYLFRKGRPTIAIRQTEEYSQPLCALCLHPIGYYAETWAGAMCPTDEVIAHLLMMRGSEEKYWANANQHPVDRPTAGV